jgi:hypothetical protein
MSQHKIALITEVRQAKGERDAAISEADYATANAEAVQLAYNMDQASLEDLLAARTVEAKALKRKWKAQKALSDLFPSVVKPMHFEYYGN